MFTRTQLIKLLAPLIVEQILTVLVGMADVVMVAGGGGAGGCGAPAPGRPGPGNKKKIHNRGAGGGKTPAIPFCCPGGNFSLAL